MNPRSEREIFKAPEFLIMEKEHGYAKKVARAATNHLAT
jgi:hypothetical protein